jgi:hypothetical protein
LEEIEIGNRFGVLQNAVNYKQTPEACLKRLASGVGMEARLIANDCVVCLWELWVSENWQRRQGYRRPVH